jgi:hypothetical protein
MCVFCFIINLPYKERDFMTDALAMKRALLSEWEAQVSRLTILIEALRAELGESISTSIEGEKSNIHSVQVINSNLRVEDVIKPGDLFGMTQLGAAKEFLTRLNRKTASLEDISAALYRGKAIETPFDEKGIRNLSSTLSRSDDFISVAKGRWGLKEWYPNRAKRRRRSAEATEGVESVE